MARVFVVNNSMHDYTLADSFGELVNVTEGKVAIFKTDLVLGMLKEGLKDFSIDDYLLVSGPAWLAMISTMILFSKLSEVKFLIFDAKQREYVVRHLRKDNF